MILNLYGCGFAGLVSALGLCESSHKVNAIDISSEKVKNLKEGCDESIGPQLSSLIIKYSGNELNFFNSSEEPTNVPINIITVPTPFVESNLNTSAVLDVIEHILQKSNQDLKPIIIIRSTLPINGLLNIENQIESKTHKTSGKDFELFYVPEFMREGTGLKDWYDPPLSLIGFNKSKFNPILLEVFSHCEYEIAPSSEVEAVKLLSNAFHATKVSFANEALRICQNNNISATNVMNSFCKDTKLNISTKYLNPGFPWGGSCLGKDTQALINNSDDFPLLSGAINSNKKHIEFYKNKILQTKSKSIGILGLSFKENVLDNRNSPILNLIEALEPNDEISKINIYKLEKNQLHLNRKKIFLSENISDINESDFIIFRHELNDFPGFNYKSKNKSHIIKI